MAFQNALGELSGNRIPVPAHSLHAEEVVKRAWEELRSLRRQRADIMKRIGTVRQTILGLATLFEGSMSDDELLDLNGRKANGRQTGFTKAIRIMLMQSRTRCVPPKCETAWRTKASRWSTTRVPWPV